MAEILTSIQGREFGLDAAGLPVWNLADGAQIAPSKLAMLSLAALAGMATLQAVLPYRLAPWGDSRSAFQAAGYTDPGLVGSSGASFDPTKCASYVGGILGDAECVGSYGVSGDTVLLSGSSGWASATRTNGKTLASLITCAPDLVTIQYGVNDINNNYATMTSYAAADALVATILASLKQFVCVLVSQGYKFVWETSYPCQAAGWTGNPSYCQYALDQLNAQMSAWVAANFVQPGIGAVADVATALKQADGYANSTYYLSATNIHLNPVGALLAAGIVATAVRTLLPAKAGIVACAPTASRLTTPAPNWIPRFSAATNVGNNDYGTGTTNSSGWGLDPKTGEPYFEVVWTPTSLGANGFARVRIMIQASLGAATSYFTLTGTEVVEGSARITLDDGAGRAPNAFNIVLRQRLFGTSGFFTDWGGTSSAAGTDYSAPVNLRLATPRIANPNNSAALTAPAGDNTGYALYPMVESKRLGVPVRIRIYSPTLQQVGVSTAVATVTTPASASAYTNATDSLQEVVVSGGTVSAIALNGTSLGLTSGVFVLRPGDTLTPTYTVAPTMLSRQLA